jgi:hypothetical protein
MELKQQDGRRSVTLAIEIFFARRGTFRPLQRRGLSTAQFQVLPVTAEIRPPENHCGSNFGVPNLLEIYRRANRQYR